MRLQIHDRIVRIFTLRQYLVEIYLACRGRLVLSLNYGLRKPIGMSNGTLRFLYSCILVLRIKPKERI